MPALATHSAGIVRDARKLKDLIAAAKPVAGRSFGGGLTLSISEAQAQRGDGTWALRYRHAGKQREMKLGNYPDMPLERLPKIEKRCTPGSRTLV
jgi:hypothetical protein